jgi:hypothetical protein
MKSNIDVKLEAKNLGLDIAKLTQSLKKQLFMSLDNLSQNVQGLAHILAGQKLHSTRDTWLAGLDDIRQVTDNSYLYVIFLKPNDISNKIENGYPSYDMKPGLLKGEDKVTIPIESHPTAKTAAAPRVLDLRSQMLSIIKNEKKKLSSYSVDHPEKGKITVTRYDSTGVKFQTAKGQVKELQNLVKVHQHSNNSTKFLTFLTLSKNTDASKWIHPGFQGAHIFPDLDNYVRQQINQILSLIAKEGK